MTYQDGRQDAVLYSMQITIPIKALMLPNNLLGKNTKLSQRQYGEVFSPLAKRIDFVLYYGLGVRQSLIQF